MKKRIAAAMLCLFIFVSVFAQEEVSAVAPEALPDYDPKYEKKYVGLAIGNMLLYNFAMFALDRWAFKMPYSYVNGASIKRNFTTGMEWDIDPYWLNFIAHPYQGAFYHASARAANLNTYESFLITLAGAALWEWFGETELPAKNDMVFTTFGAFALGEMLYRLSLEADGISRVLSYIAAPGRGLVDLELWRKPNKHPNYTYEFSWVLGAGTSVAHTRLSNWTQPYSDREIYPAFADVGFYAVYNNPYTWESREPYSQFELRVNGSLGAGSGKTFGPPAVRYMMYDLSWQSNGVFYSKAYEVSEDTNMTLGFILESDIMYHSMAEFSAIGPGLALKRMHKTKNGGKIEWQAHLDWAMLGCSDNYRYGRDLLSKGEGFREYGFSTGVETVFSVRGTTKLGHMIDFDFRCYMMYCFSIFKNNFTPGSGMDVIGVLNLNYEIQLTKMLNLGIGNRLYLKQTFYDEFPETFQVMYTPRIYTRIKLK